MVMKNSRAYPHAKDSGISGLAQTVRQLMVVAYPSSKFDANSIRRQRFGRLLARLFWTHSAEQQHPPSHETSSIRKVRPERQLERKIDLHPRADLCPSVSL